MKCKLDAGSFIGKFYISLGETYIPFVNFVEYGDQKQKLLPLAQQPKPDDPFFPTRCGLDHRLNSLFLVLPAIEDRIVQKGMPRTSKEFPRLVMANG